MVVTRRADRSIWVNMSKGGLCMCVSAGKKLYKRQGEVESCFLLQLFVMSSEESIKKAKSALQKACENGTSQVKRYTLSHSLYTVLLHYVDWLPTSFSFSFFSPDTIGTTIPPRNTTALLLRSAVDRVIFSFYYTLTLCQQPLSLYSLWQHMLCAVI